MNYYQFSVNRSIDELQSNIELGLSKAIAQKRLTEFGPNQLIDKQSNKVIELIGHQFKDVFIIILIVAAILSGIIGEWSDAIVILIIILLNAIVGFIQEYHAENTLKALKKIAATQVRTIRDGRVIIIREFELVPGDIVLLQAGNAVPADMRLINSHNLKVNESSLTGESTDILKQDQALHEQYIPTANKSNMVFKGTFINSGRCKGLVVATGMKTELGSIASLLQTEKSTNGLRKRMRKFGGTLSIIILCLSFVFFMVSWLNGAALLTTLLTSVSIAVAAIPEALPAVITISLALAARKMFAANTLVRKLSAVETLGAVKYICTDKTGTITQNKMMVTHVYTNNQLYNGDTELLDKNNQSIQLLFEAMLSNNDAITLENNLYHGNSIEIALINYAKSVDTTFISLHRISEIPFDSRRKLMTTFHKKGSQFISFTKGAPDILIKHCNGGDTNKLDNIINEMAAKGLKTLGFAYKIWDEIPEKLSHAIHETDLVFLGLVGIIDPPRPEVIRALDSCKKAGIITVMITGDHLLTAKSIAKQTGIISSDKDLVISGEDLSLLSEDELNNNIEHIKVYARVSPEQKLRIIQALQFKDYFVAMTGDGINDAPSLKRADIGIAMGITGTDVAKQAADIILLDDNFSSIVKAIREGRCVYDNIVKFIKFMMTTNLGELLTILVGPLFGLPIAILPIHILWINLVSDGLPAICFSYEKGEINLMKKDPAKFSGNVFSKEMIIHIIWAGLLMSSLALLIQFIAIKYQLNSQTMVFNYLCFAQLFHALSIRTNAKISTIREFLSNRKMIAAALGTLFIQMMIIYHPPLNIIFSTSSLNLIEMSIILVAASVVYLAVELEKRKSLYPSK